MEEPIQKPRRFAHKGIWQKHPENTLEAYKEAVNMGCEGIELDINPTKDNNIICVHNDTPEEMTNGADKRPFIEMTVEEIKKINIPYHNQLLPNKPPVPWTEKAGGMKIHNDEVVDHRVTHYITFEEFDQWFETVKKDVQVEVEFKKIGMIGKMNEILSKSKNVNRYILFSGDMKILNEIQDFYKKNKIPEGLRLGANIRRINDQTMEFVKNCNTKLYEVGLNNELFNKQDVEMFESMGIKVFSNLGDYEEWWAKLKDFGVEGFKTNYVDAYNDFIKIKK